MMVNEIAPRVHNSGHLTADACFCGQFEQHIRAIAGWPLGNPSAHSHAVMTNLLGDEVADWADLARQGNAKLHLYGKQDAKPGRKMGHVTRLTAKKPRLIAVGLTIFGAHCRAGGFCGLLCRFAPTSHAG